MMRCPKCEYVTGVDSNRFCYRDGTELVPLKKCECGHEITSIDVYCGKCGRKVAASKEETTPAPEPQLNSIN